MMDWTVSLKSVWPNLYSQASQEEWERERERARERVRERAPGDARCEMRNETKQRQGDEWKQVFVVVPQYPYSVRSAVRWWTAMFQRRYRGCAAQCSALLVLRCPVSVPKVGILGRRSALTSRLGGLRTSRREHGKWGS
ncbi:hypothetical protein CSPX01_12474 [Colletotrichum filicis]|nr:hypothetical protein CSPX01_12474 [Colletotrichum filicis]